MSDISNNDAQTTIDINMQGNAQQGAAELANQIINLSQQLAQLSQRAVQSANVTRSFNQAMGLSTKGVSQHSREVTNSLNPIARMNRAVEMSKKIHIEAARAAEQYYSVHRAGQTGLMNPEGYAKINSGMSQSISHMKAMKNSSKDLQTALKQVALQDVARTIQSNALVSQQSAYNFMRNFSLPVIAGLREAFFSYSKLVTESNRTTKLILDNFGQIGMAANGGLEAQIKAARAFTRELSKDLDKITMQWGTSRVLIQSLAGDFAELGISSRIVLADLTRLTAETEKLGNLDISQSSEFIQSMYQTILRIRRETGKSVDINSDSVANEILSQLKGQLAVFNMIENKTVMSLRNISDAFPEVTAAATSFGLSMTEAMSLVIPMVGAGFQIGASANSVKVSLQRMVAMTKQNTDIINQLNAEMGDGFNYTAGVGMENIQLLSDAYGKLSKDVSQGGKGKQGALELFARLFGVRQGPRMETSLAQYNAFQVQLDTIGSNERKVADTLQDSINIELRAIGAKGVAIKKFSDLSKIHRMAIEKDGNDILTVQAKAIQKGQIRAQKLLEQNKANNSDFISGMSTEVGKALMAQAFDANSLAGKQFEAELKLSQDTPEVRYRRAKESLMALGRAVVPVVDSIIKFLLPAFEKLATFLQDNPFLARIISGFLGLVAVSGPLKLAFNSIKIAFGSLINLFLKTRSAVTGTKYAIASLQDLILNPNLLRGQERVVQYLDGFLVKTKRGAKELRETMDFSGMEASSAEMIRRGGIYGDTKKVNMQRIAPFAPETAQFRTDLIDIQKKTGAETASKIAKATKDGVEEGTSGLSGELQRMFANTMHTFKGPNLFAGPNYFQNNIPLDGGTGGPVSPRNRRGGGTGTGAGAPVVILNDDLSPEESASVISKIKENKMRKSGVITYPKGSLFPRPGAKSFPELSILLDAKIKQEKMASMFVPATNMAAGAAQAASVAMKPQQPFNPAQLLSNISQNRIALGRDPLGPVAIQRFLSKAADNVTLSFDQIRSWYIEAGKPISQQLEYAFSKGGVFTVSKNTLESVKTKIFDKTKQGIFSLATGEQGVDKRLKGLASIRGFKNMGKTVQTDLVPIIASVSDSIAEQVDVGLNQTLATLNELKLDNMLQTPMGATGRTITDLTAGKPVLIDDVKRAIEDHFIAAELVTNGVVKQSSTTVVNSLKDIDKLLPDIVDQIDIIANEAGPLSSYGDDLRRAFRDVRAKTHRFVESVNASGQKMVTLVKNEVLVPGNDERLQIKAADQSALSANKAAEQTAKKAGEVRPDYAFNKKVDEARARIQKLREAKIASLTRVTSTKPPLPTDPAGLKGALKGLDGLIAEQAQEIEDTKKKLEATRAAAKSVIDQEISLQTTKQGKTSVRNLGKNRLKEIQEEFDFELGLMQANEKRLLARRNLVLSGSPAGIQKQIDDAMSSLPRDVRSAIQNVDKAINDEINNLSRATERRLARYKKGMSGIGQKIRAAVPQRITGQGGAGALDIVKYSGSRFFNDSRFQQPNARMFDAQRGLSFPSSIKSFFGMDRVKGVFKAPRSLSAAAITHGEQIIFQFAEQLEAQLGNVLSNTVQGDIKHITRVLQNLKGTSVNKDLAKFMTSIVNLPQDQIEMAMGNALTEIKRSVAGATGAGVGGKGMKAGTLQSWKAFLERMRRGSQGLDTDASGNAVIKGVREFFFSGKINPGQINATSTKGVTTALESAFVTAMKGGFKGLDGAADAGVTEVSRRLLMDSNKAGLVRKRTTKKALKDAGKKVSEVAKGFANDIEGFLTAPATVMADIASKVDMAGAKSSSIIKAATDKVMKPIVKVYKPGELFPGRAPVITQATAAAGASVAPTPLTLRDLKNTGIELPGTKRQAEKMLESAQKELARQLGIDAKASGASAKIKKLSVANFEKEIARLQGMIAGEQQLLNTFTSPAMRKGPERNLAKLNKQLKELALARDKYVVAEFALANAAAKAVPTAPSTITPTGTTGAAAPAAPPPRAPSAPTPVAPTPVVPTSAAPKIASGGSGKIIDIKKIGNVYRGPNLFQGPNIFDSNLSDLIPNFDEVTKPAKEAAEALAESGDAAAAAIVGAATAVSAKTAAANTSGAGAAGGASLLSRIKTGIFGNKGASLLSPGMGLSNISGTDLPENLIKNRLRLSLDDSGVISKITRIKKLGGETEISFDRANKILSGKLIPSFTRLNQLFSTKQMKLWLFTLTGGLSAAISPLRKVASLVKEVAIGQGNRIAKGKEAIQNLNLSRVGEGKKPAGKMLSSLSFLQGATGGFSSLASAGSKVLNVFFKIASMIALIGAAALVAVPIIVLIFGLINAWKNASGRLGGVTDSLKRSLGNLKDAVMALFAPIRDVFNSFVNAGESSKIFATEGEKNASMFLKIAMAIENGTSAIKKWAETTGKAFVTNSIAPFLVRLINRFILLGGAIKSAFSGDKTGAMKKFKAFMYSLIYEVLSFTRGMTDIIIQVIQALIPVFVYVAKAGVLVFGEMFKELVRMAVNSASDIGNTLGRGVMGALLGPTATDAYFKYIGDPAEYLITGKKVGKSYNDGFSDSITSGLEGLLDPLKQTLNTTLTKGMSATAIKYAELMGKGINIPLAQKLKNPKAFKEALAYNAKQSADAATAAGETLGGNVNKGVTDKMKEIKETIKGYFYSNVDEKFDSIIQQYTDALSDQKDAQLKAYDDQIAGIDALADAEERLTAKKEYELKRRDLIDQRAASRENYLIERRLAVYEGRVFDVRKLDREEIVSQRNSNKDLEDLDSGRLSQLQSEQRDLAKQAISNQKDIAEKQFKTILDTFDKFIEDVKNKGFATQEEFTAALKKVGDEAVKSSGTLSTTFRQGLDALPAAIAAVRDPSIKMFSENMDSLIREASKKFGLDTKNSDPSTILGAVAMLASGTESGFKDAFNPIFATTYVQPAVVAIAKVAASLSKEGDPNNIVEIWRKAGEDAFNKIKNELNRDIQFPKILKGFSDLVADLKPLVKQIVDLAGGAKDALSGIGEGATAGYIFTNKDRSDLAELLVDLVPSSVVGGKIDKMELNAPTIQRVVQVIADNYERGSGYIMDNLSRFGLSAFEKSLLSDYLKSQGIGSGRTDSKGRSGFMYGGSVRKYGMGGYLESPASQGIPALLHGGEYIINHKAVEKFGKGNLEKINNLKNGGDFRGFASGGYMTVPGFGNGGYMTVPGFAKGGSVGKRGSADAMEMASASPKFIGPMPPVVKPKKQSVFGKVGGFLSKAVTDTVQSFAKIGSGGFNIASALVESPLALLDKRLSFNPITNLQKRNQDQIDDGINYIRGINKITGLNIPGGKTGGYGQIAGGKLTNLGDSFNVATSIPGLGSGFKIAPSIARLAVAKMGLSGSGMTLGQIMKPGVMAVMNNALTREATALAGKIVLQGFDSTMLNPANIIDTQAAKPILALPSPSVKTPRVFPVSEKGNAPTMFGSDSAFQRGDGAAFDQQVLNLFDELDAIALGQTEDLSTVARREILRARLQVQGVIPKVMQSPEDLAFYNNMLNDLLGNFRNNAKGVTGVDPEAFGDITAIFGAFDRAISKAFKPKGVDPRIIPSSGEVIDFYNLQQDIAWSTGDLLKNPQGVMPQDVVENIAKARNIKEGKEWWVQEQMDLLLPKANQPINYINRFGPGGEDIYKETSDIFMSLRERMALAPKELTTGGSGGALQVIKKMIPIKTYKSGTGVLGEMPKYNYESGTFDLKQLGLYVHKIGKENVVFGGMKNALKGLVRKNPHLNIKSVGLNPYEIANLRPGTSEGDAIANQWARALIGYTDVMGNSEDDTFISALLYNWKRNKDLFAMLKFKQYESLGSILVNEQKAVTSGKTESMIAHLVKDKKDYFKLKDLFVTHETPFPVNIDELGNLTLKPLSAFDTTSMLPKGEYSGGPFQLGKKAEYFRDTLHFALNHRVIGHGGRQNIEEGNFIISQLLPLLKNNPEALDNLYSVDTFFTPPPGKGLNFPAGTFRVIPIKKGSGVSPTDELKKYMIEVLGITEQADAGSTFGTISPEQIVQKYMIRGGEHGAEDNSGNVISYLFAKLLGVKSGRHFDQFGATTVFGGLKKGANVKPSEYFNFGTYPLAGENAWSRVMSRDPFAQNFEMPYDNPQLMEKIQKIYDAFKLNKMSYPGGMPYKPRSSYNGGYMPKFKKGGYLKFKEGGEVPSILHGGEYVLNSAAVRKYGLAHLEAMNQMRFKVPSAGFSVPQSTYSGTAAGGMTTSTQNVNIYVDNFIGEPEWFNSMMKDYNTKILPKNQKAAGLENRVISTYNGLNRGQ